MAVSEKLPLLPARARSKRAHPTLVIHGGAGTFTKEGSTPAQREKYVAALKKALIAGKQVLDAGGEAMDAAVAAVSVMEDCPLFNCAKGAVFNVAGKNELEASIALSKPPPTHTHIPQSRRGVSVTLLTRARNPSQLAQALYLSPELAPHAFLSGSNAEVEIGNGKLGIELVDPSYYYTDSRWREHRRGLGLPEDEVPGSIEDNLDPMPTGTVGAVALDVNGCIAAVTSTGGRTNKLVGRIGDTPSMGSGFWAEEWKIKRRNPLIRACRALLGLKHEKDQAVGVSGTGDGDYFIRRATAVSLARRMQDLGESVLKAADHVVADLKKDGGIGGVIALDHKGNVARSQNCPGMYFGTIGKDGIPRTAIFKDDIVQ